MPQARKLLNAVMLVHFHEAGETSDLVVGKAHLPRSSAAGVRALRPVKNRHDEHLMFFLYPRQWAVCKLTAKNFEHPENPLAQNLARVSLFHPGMRQSCSAHLRVEQMRQTKCHCNRVR